MLRRCGTSFSDLPETTISRTTGHVLEEGLGDEESCTIAMEILDEAAAEGVFVPEAGQCLARLHAPMGDNFPDRIAEVLEILVHDGYLEATEHGHRFQFPLLKDWWKARHCDHHLPIRSRVSGEA